MSDSTNNPLNDRFLPFQESQSVRSMRAAEKEMAERYAISEMPDDLREAAKRWDVENLMNAVWLHAFNVGYRAGRNRHDQ